MPNKPRRVCTYVAPDGTPCERPHLGRGLCKAHHTQLMRGQELRPIRTVRTGCDYIAPDGTPCDRPHSTRGLCDAHTAQQRRGQELVPIGEWQRTHHHQPKPPCIFDDCGRDTYARGMCRAHYQQERKGEPLRPVKRTKPGQGCSVDGCTGDHKARGLCALHYRQWTRGQAIAALPLKPAKPKPAPKPAKKRKKPKPGDLPKGWDRPARPGQTAAIAGGFKALGAVPPMDPAMLETAVRTVAHSARAFDFDLADMLDAVGLTADKLEANAERWAMVTGQDAA